MRASKLLNLFGITLIAFLIFAAPIQSAAASKAKDQTDTSDKDRLVLMPLIANCASGR
jgi:hypothetical protein